MISSPLRIRLGTWMRLKLVTRPRRPLCHTITHLELAIRVEELGRLSPMTSINTRDLDLVLLPRSVVDRRTTRCAPLMPSHCTSQCLSRDNSHCSIPGAIAVFTGFTIPVLTTFQCTPFVCWAGSGHRRGHYRCDHQQQTSRLSPRICWFDLGIFFIVLRHHSVLLLVFFHHFTSDAVQLVLGFFILWSQ